MNLPRKRISLLATLLTNALPVVGVAFLDWSLTALVLVYWFELGVALLFATVRAVFAQHPPDHPRDLLVLGGVRHKRGWVSIPGTSLRIQFANIPVVMVGVPAFGLVWLLSGVVAVGGLGQPSSGELLHESAATTAGLGMLGVIGGRGLETVADYFLTGQYRKVNVQLALQSAIWPILVVGLALIVSATGVATGWPTGLILVALVGTKFLFDLVGIYRDRLRAFDERTDISFGWAYEPPERSPVDESLAEPAETVHPNPWGVLINGPVRGLKTDAVAFPLFIGFISVVTVLASGERTMLLFGGGLAVVVVLLLAVLGTVDQATRYLTMEYRVGEVVVGYDRLLGEPQWRLPAWKLARGESHQTLVDQLLGTETLVVTHDDRTIRLSHLPDVEAVRPTNTDD